MGHIDTMRSMVIFACAFFLGTAHKYLVDVDDSGKIQEIQYKHVDKHYNIGQDCFLNWNNINWANMDDTVVQWVQKRFSEAYQLLHRLQHDRQNQHHLIRSTIDESEHKNGKNQERDLLVETKNINI